MSFTDASLPGGTQTLFTVRVWQSENGTMAISPALPADGKLPAGSVIKVTATPARGYAVDSVFHAIPGVYGREAYETASSSLTVILDRDMEIGASFIEQEALEGFIVQPDIVYAQPGVKPLKYDVFTPDGARQLPAILIVHGGGWVANREDIMRGLARELVRGGRYVVASIDYRWVGTADGDKTPTTMNQIIEDVFGAIAHFQEHAESYGADPTRLGLTGDSAGGYLSAAAIMLVDQIGDDGFGKPAGVYQFRPTYLPAGKSAAQVRTEIKAALKGAAPSYGLFASNGFGGQLEGLDPAAIAAIMPLEHIPNVRDRAVPHFLLRGSRDDLIPHEGVQAYVDALQAAGQRAEYLVVAGAGHAFLDWKPDAGTKATFAKYGIPSAAKMERFFDSIFWTDSNSPSPPPT
jgi:acetyl esterase